MRSMTGIVATLWPATANKAMIWKLHQAGVNIFRCNFAHENYSSGKKIINIIRALEQEHWVKIHTLLDAEWPGIRTGTLDKDIRYTTGEQFQIFVNDKLSGDKSLFCDYIHLPQDVKVGGIMKIDAGMFQVKILEVHSDYIRVQALNAYTVWSRRHINLPGVHVNIPSFTDKDKEDVLFAIKYWFDYVALSFVRSEKDMRELRAFLDTHNGQHIKTIAKIENEEWITNISVIVQASDMVMVARGDLWAELPIENIPIYQLDIIQHSKLQQKKVIVATEILESMIHQQIPTRAEISDIFYAVVGGADYLMLSGETAIGKYPLQSVQMMKKTIDAAQKYI